MLSAIINGITAIVDAVTTLFTFLLDFVAGIAKFVASLVTIPDSIDDILTGALPTVVVTGLLACIAAVIVVRVVGRD